MTAQDTATRRSIVLTCDADEPTQSTAYRLLSELGHEVTPVSSADRAVSALQRESADLVVVDLDAAAELGDLYRLFEALPAGRQPRQVAVFSDHVDQSPT